MRSLVRNLSIAHVTIYGVVRQLTCERQQTTDSRFARGLFSRDSIRFEGKRNGASFRREGQTFSGDRRRGERMMNDCK